MATLASQRPSPAGVRGRFSGIPGGLAMVHIMSASSLGKCQPRRTGDGPYNGGFKLRQVSTSRTGDGPYNGGFKFRQVS